MRTYIKKYKAHKVPQEVHKFCYSNNLRDDGDMRYDYIRTRENKDGYVLVAHDGEQFLGWALVLPSYHSNRYAQHLYVPKRHRRKGIGTKLHKKVENTFGNVEVFPDGDEQAWNFYSAIGRI